MFKGLNYHRCTPETCRFHGKSIRHTQGVRDNGHEFDAAVIPEALAAEVADCVNGKFSMAGLHVRRIPEPTVTKEEITVFNEMMRMENDFDRYKEKYASDLTQYDDLSA